MKKLFQRVDEQQTQMIQDVLDIVRQPSVSAQKIGLEETADLLVKKMNSIGIKTEKFPLKNGSPSVVYGEVKGKSDKTILFYNHYDTQPPEPFDLWVSPPFEPEVRDGKMYGRGIADNKGPLFTRLHAIQTILETDGELPVNVKFIIDSEEEIGSPNLQPFILENKEKLRADACIWEFCAKDEMGRPGAYLGNKGMLYVELRVKAATSDYHSKFAAVIPSAAWRLVGALSTMRDLNENILIDGFYDSVRDLSKEEYDLLVPFAEEAEKVRNRANVESLVKQAQGIEYAKQLFNSPTCNISGISSGYTGNGSKTVLPCYAMAKLDFRLVVDQDPDEIVKLLRAHLDKHGFEDVEIHILSKCKPSKTPASTPFLDVVFEAGKFVYDKPFVVGPTMPGTGPRALFSQWTDMPIISLGPGYPGTKNHAPNENLVLTDYFEAVKHIIAILYKYAEK